MTSFRFPNVSYRLKQTFLRSDSSENSHQFVER